MTGAGVGGEGGVSPQAFNEVLRKRSTMVSWFPLTGILSETHSQAAGAVCSLLSCAFQEAFPPPHTNIIQWSPCGRADDHGGLWASRLRKAGEEQFGSRVTKAASLEGQETAIGASK